jgi:hypothetical protein
MDIRLSSVKWLYDKYGSYQRMHVSQPVAMQTAEETAALDRIVTTLETYSQELMVDLIIGNRSIDDFDKYIAEMQSLGLDEYISIYQARYDRYRSLSQ